MEEQEPIIVSVDTLHPQDLALSFLSFLAGEDEKTWERIKTDVPNYVCDRYGRDWWWSEAADDILEDLWNALEEIAAEKEMVFGAHPGDGACFGFWPTDLFD